MAVRHVWQVLLRRMLSTTPSMHSTTTTNISLRHTFDWPKAETRVVAARRVHTLPQNAVSHPPCSLHCIAVVTPRHINTTARKLCVEMFIVVVFPRWSHHAVSNHNAELWLKKERRLWLKKQECALAIEHWQAIDVCIEYVLLTSGGCLGLLHSRNDHYMNIFSTGRF